jgi:E3 ubiquitin-protein ligase BAH
LTFDAEFFDILLDDVTSLDALQTDEQKILSDEIEALSTEVTAVTKYGEHLHLLVAYIQSIKG